MSSPVTPEVHGRNSSNSLRRTLSSRNAIIFNSPELSDVKFVFKISSGTGGRYGHGQRGQEIIYGHKLILALASPVFHKMFYMDKNNEQFVTTVSDDMHMNDSGFSADAFLEFIRFVYTNRIDYKNLDCDVIVGLISCADYYDVPCLKRECVDELEKIIRKENVIQILETAQTFRDGKLADKALEFIDQNLITMLEYASEQILCTKLETLFKILKRDSLDVDECVVLDLALKWTGRECKKKKLKAGNKREVLGKVFFEIRFGLLSSDRISELVSSNLLTREESLDIVLEGHTPGYVTMAGNSKFKRRRLAPEAGFKTNPRIYGEKKKLMEIHEMEEKWKERNNFEYLKGMSLATCRANLFMRGFPWNKTKMEIRNEIEQGPSVFDLEVKKLGQNHGEFHVRFKYNSSEYRLSKLLDPAWYGFVNPHSIHIQASHDDD